MKKFCLQRIVVSILTICLIIGLAACGNTGSTHQLPEFSSDFSEPVTNPYSFQGEASETLYISPETIQTVLDITSQPTDYPYSDLYEIDEVRKRLDFDATVEIHQFSPLDASGQLTGESLARCVSVNNDAFMADKPFNYETIPQENVLEICKFVVEIVSRMKQTHPDIDWNRVYCNLGNLKILCKTGMLSYAQVNDKMVLCLSGLSANIANVLEGEDGYSRILVHEIMHILQMGCTCEQIENCSRRAGICCYYDDFTLNFADWTWMVEGSAERNMCQLTGSGAVSYQYKMDYLCSMTMAVLLRSDVEADTIEDLCFQSDPELLFAAFGCETQTQRDELICMMITLQILQMQPDAFYQEYQKKTGIDLSADEESLNQFSYSLKPAVCITLAKEFYGNLVDYMAKTSLSANDLFCLLRLFEGHLNQHLDYNKQEKESYNQAFFDFYRQLRQTFLTCLQEDNPQLDIQSLYDSYSLISGGEYTLNAALSDLPREKQEFLLERAAWQADLLELGVTVP